MNAPFDDAASVLALERAAFDAWPAAEVEVLDGLRLRATAGVTRRANSAWTSELASARPLGELIRAVEVFYAERGLPSQFMLSPLSPPALDAELAARGYRIDAPVVIRVAKASHVAELASSHAVSVAPRPSAEFLQALVEHGRYREVERHFVGILGRLEGRASYAGVTLDGAVAGAGFGVLAGELCGLFGMFTLPDFRRRGVARAVAVALAREAERAGARLVYLQVERDNAAALALYATLGFHDAYGYHYRVAGARQGDARETEPHG